MNWICCLARLALTLALISLVPAWAGQDKAAKAEKPAADTVKVDKAKKTITIDCKIAPRKINDPKFKEIYPIEVIASWEFPKGQKAHETVVTIACKPSEIHQALEGLGLKAGTPVVGGGKKDVPQGPEVEILIEFAAADGQPKKVPIERSLIDPKTKKPMPKLKWLFTGSVMKQPDPTKADKVYGADLTGTLISIFPVTDQTVFQTNLTMAEEKYIKLETDKELLPKEGTAAKLIIQVPAK